MKKCLKRILTFTVCFILLFVLVFTVYQPKKTKADVLGVAALGVSALSTLVASYFTTAGVEFAGRNADGASLGNYIGNWVKNSSSFAGNPYFNNDGSFKGSSTDASIVQNNDTNAVSIIFGKEFAMWLEVLKQSFVGTHNLEEDVMKPLTISNSISATDGEIYPVLIDPVLPTSYIPSIVSKEVGHHYIGITSQYIIDFLVNSIGPNETSTMSATMRYSINGGASYVDLFTFSYNTQGRYTSFQMRVVTGNDYLQIGAYNPRYYNQPDNAWNEYFYNTAIPVSAMNISSMSLNGALTDGYEDFQEAMENDVENSEDQDLVIGTNVGIWEQIGDLTDRIGGILDRIIAGELHPSYEGTFDDQEEAEEELEGTKPFVPVLPDGWVKVEGLQSFFPFCIPWDIASVIQMLNVPAEAPHFQWKMGFGSKFDPYYIDIDLAPYEMVARVFRIMVVIGFLLFLIIKTRDLIRG